MPLLSFRVRVAVVVSLVCVALTSLAVPPAAGSGASAALKPTAGVPAGERLVAQDAVYLSGAASGRVFSFGGVSSSGKGSEVRRVRVVLGIGPDGSRDATTREDLQRVFADVNRFYQTVSAGKVRFKLAAVSSWRRVPVPCSLQDLDKVAAQLKFPVGGRDHVLLYQPGCKGAGYAQVFGNLVFINGGMSSEVFAHELGHNLGLGHSNFAACSLLLSLRPCSAKKERASAIEYGDTSDVMGGYPWFDGANRPTSAEITSGLSPYHLDVLKVAVKTVSVSPAKLTRPVEVTLSERGSDRGVKAVRVWWNNTWVLLSLMGPKTAPRGAGLGVLDTAPPAVLLAHAPAGFFTNVHAFNAFRPLKEGLNPLYTPMGSGLFAGATLPLSKSTVLEVVEVSESSAKLRFRTVDDRDPSSVQVRADGDRAQVSWTVAAGAGPVRQTVTGFQLVGLYPASAPAVDVPVGVSSVDVPRGSWFHTDWRFLVTVEYADGSSRSMLSDSVPVKK